jgi:hypothetical protein
MEQETFINDPEEKRAAETAKLLADRFEPEPAKRPVGRPKKIISDEREKQMWHDAAIAAIASMQINHIGHIQKAFDFADEYVRLSKDRMEQASTS